MIVFLETPEEGQRTYRPQRCGNNNEDKDKSPKTFNDKNHQASSQKFRKLMIQFNTNNLFNTNNDSKKKIGPFYSTQR